VPPDKLFAFLDQVSEIVEKDEFMDHFHLLTAGIKSMTSTFTSILAKYETKDTFAGRGSKFDQMILDPRLTRDVTKQTKILAKHDISIAVDNTAPAARELGKKSAAVKKGRVWIPISQVSWSSINDLSQPTISGIVKDIPLIASVHERVKAYYQIVSMMFARTSRKSIKMIGGECARSAALSEMVDYLASLTIKQYWRPAVLLYKCSTNQTIDSLLDDEKMKLGGIKEVLVYFKMDTRDQKLCDGGDLGVREFFVVCRSGVSDGSFTGDSNLKFAVMHDVLVTRVSISHYSFL
jgi:hypothetical protein